MDDLVRGYVLPAAFSILPPHMNTPAAIQMLMAIGWQESRFSHRAQIHGPARGFWQFERGGGWVGVLKHVKTGKIAAEVLRKLEYPTLDFNALADNDILAAAFARLLLYTDPEPIAKLPEQAWEQYMRIWRPGKPHPENWALAWQFARME